MPSSKFTVCFTKEIKQKVRGIAKTREIQAKSLVFSFFKGKLKVSKLFLKSLNSMNLKNSKIFPLSNSVNNAFLQSFPRKY